MMTEKTNIEYRTENIESRSGVMIDPDASLTTEEAAKFLKVDTQEVLRYVKLGLPHYEGMGKGFRFVRKDLIEWREKYRNKMEFGRRHGRAA